MNTLQRRSFSSVPSVVRQLTDKRKVVPARFILDSINLNPHKIEAHSTGKGFPFDELPSTRHFPPESGRYVSPVAHI